MNQSIQWQTDDIIPDKEGWYTVMRDDETLCLRVYGCGRWWVPLRDNWLLQEPKNFKWFGPVMSLGWCTPLKTEKIVIRVPSSIEVFKRKESKQRRKLNESINRVEE